MRSLRTRLVVAVVALLAAACLSIALVSTIALRHFLVDRLDSQLSAADTRTSDADGDGRGGGGDRGRGGDSFLLASGQTPGTIGVRVDNGSVTASGVLNESGSLDMLSSAGSAALTAVPVSSAPTTIQVPGLGDYRVVASQSRGGDVLVTGLPLSTVDDAVHRLVLVEVVVSLLALIVTGLGGAVIVRRTLRPLQRVAAVAARVSDVPLERGEVELAERVPTRDTDPRTEVGQVGAALNQLLDHVDAALTARQASETRVRQFVADASHELRTPLASIRGYAELHRRSPDLVPPAVAAALGRVESEAVRMTSLVEDLLLLARLDNGRPLAQDVVDVSALLVEAVSDAAVTSRDHTWRLELPDKPIEVAGDEPRLRQVLVNLLANARTHTPPGSTVTASGVEPTGGGALITVTDDGPGLAPELLPRVFERFTRGDAARTRTSGSTGLGLAIASSIVTAHHGELTVQSRPGQTAFTVRLPPAGRMPGSQEPDSNGIARS